VNDVESAALAKSLSHPVRMALIRALRDGGTLSASEFAKTDKAALGVISYHINGLADTGVLEVVETIQRRGAMERRFAIGGPNAELTLQVVDILAAY
jgi:DNA-binding transcriptional ArsR family regulator